MLDLRIGRLVRFVGWLATLGASNSMALGDAPPAKPFVVPRDRAEWEARRPAVLAEVAPPKPEKDSPRGGKTPVVSRLSHDLAGVVVEEIAVPVEGDQVSGVLVSPKQAEESPRPTPLVVLIGDPQRPGLDCLKTPGLDGRPPALVFARFGFSTLSLDENQVGGLQAALDLLLDRPEFDPARVAVFSLGQNSRVALRLMATDMRISCGILAIDPVPGEDDREDREETSKLVALCAPRPLWLMVGEPLPLAASPRSIGRTLEHVAKGTYQVYDDRGPRLGFTLYGEFAGHNSINTRLQWMAGLEMLDKCFRPQGPTPLSHAPLPEPTFDPSDDQVIHLTSSGIAGWSSEMSFRDSTWTWDDGVVACRPGPDEYGWLRCPVEVSDFLLQVEWKVPARGNAGIFLRARPVAWILPPTEENKLRVSTLALTWPSRTGLELQTQDDPGQANRYSTGSLYRHAAPSRNPTHSPDQWNRSTVRARGLRIEVWNNGEQVLDADLSRCDDTLPNPPLRGYIGLQNHGAPAEYRAIRLKHLSPASGGAQGADTRSPATIPVGRASR